MYEFQSYSTVEQNGDALFMATPGKTRNPKPKPQTTDPNLLKHAPAQPRRAQPPPAGRRPATARSLLPAPRRRPLTPAARRDTPSALHERTRLHTAKR